ncbi:hypothetical protein ACS0TY_003278 [Phlomoides rotata]
MEGGDRTFKANFSSEGVSRLREAIEEKLKEFMGDYTDDTLVEYVIVLLKNGRSKDEAKNELDVFLGDDSDSFISWLWDHLGSNLSLYMQPLELHPDGVAKTKPAAEDQGGKIESRPTESDAQRGDFSKTHGHHNNRDNKGLMREGDENKVPLPQNSVTHNVKSRDAPRLRDSQTNSSRSPRSTIHKKRRRNEIQQPRQREVSQLTVSAPRRLLQFAVRDAVATSRPSNATTEPSLKRLRSVVSTTVDSSLEERPQRIQRASMSAAIKAMAEAVKDVTKNRPSRNVFDRLGHTINVSNTTNHQEYGGAAEDVGDGDFSVEMENFHSSYHPRNDSSRLQEENISSFLDTTMDADMGYDGLDARGQESVDISRSGTDGEIWIENSQNLQYVVADNVDETLHRTHSDFVYPGPVHNSSFRIASSVSMNTRKPQYQEEIEEADMDNHKIMLGGDTVSTKSEEWFVKENINSTVALNENAKLDNIHHQSEKTQTPTDAHNTGLPTEDADSRTIFVSNVHFAAPKDGLSRHFNKFGEVHTVIILTDPATGQPKGSAYIEFKRKEAAELALSLDGTSFMSRILKIVKKSSAQPPAAAASVTPWPRVARASQFSVPRYSRSPFTYRPRASNKPGGRSFQWKRGGDTLSQASSVVQSPTARSLTYVRPEPKTNGNSGTA